MNCIHTMTSGSTELIIQYNAVFTGLDSLEDEYHIDLDPDVKPIQHVPHREPVAMKERLKRKLEELTKQGIVTEVVEPTACISNIVIIMKSDKL